MTSFSDFTQNCWVVSDIDEAVRRWHTTTGIGPFFLLRSPAVGDFHYRGVAGELEMDVALAQAGDIQIELIQPKSDAPSAYRDACPPGGEVFHHLGKMTRNYDRDFAHYKQAGFALAQHGLAGESRFGYFDTRGVLGVMVELIEMKPGLEAMFSMIAEAAQGWDGSDPYRTIDF